MFAVIVVLVLLGLALVLVLVLVPSVRLPLDASPSFVSSIVIAVVALLALILEK